MKLLTHRLGGLTLLLALSFTVAVPLECLGHGTLVFPVSRVYRVYQSNPSNPNFQLARNAVAIDGTLSYYTWNELSRNIPQAVRANLPPGFDYSPWVPDGQLASGGRVDKQSPLYPRTYAGLDQVSANWPKTPVVAGSTITVRFLATAPHNPSVWDVWMTKPGWDPKTPLTWNQMAFLGRPNPTLASRHYTFNLKIPADRSGHHVLWVAWQRNDPVGEVFFSTSDIDVQPAARFVAYGNGCAGSNNLVPSLTNLTLPVLGQTLELEIDRAAARSTVYLFLGRRTSIDLGPLAPGCKLLTTPDAILPIGPWTGNKLRVKLAVPTNPSFLGVRVAAQAVVLDPGVARQLPIALSNGGEATIGR